MTSQEAKEWLNRAYGLNKLLKKLIKTRNSETFANISNYDLESFKGTSDNNSTESKMIAFAELNSRIEKTQNELMSENVITQKVINKCKDPVSMEILTARYVDFKGWRQIAREHNYSEQHIFRLHGTALQEVAPYVPTDYER